MPERHLVRAPQPGRRTGTVFHGVAGSLARAWLRWDIRLGVCLVLGGLLSLHAGLDNNWDLHNYHLYDPFALLHGRLGRDLNAVGTQTTFNPLLDVPYYLVSVQWLPHMPRTVAFLAGLPYGVLAFLVLAVARLLPRGQEPWQAETATAIGLCGTTVVSEIGQSYGDIQIAVLVVAALWPPLWCLAAGRERSGRWTGACAAAGLLMGTAAGLKLTACVYAPALALGLFVVIGPWQRRMAGTAAFCACWLLALGIVDGWWAAHLWARFANPMFPMMNDLFRSPWAVAGSGRDTRFLPRSVLQALFYPFWWLGGHPFVASETGVRDWHFALAYLAVAALAARGLVRRLRDRAAPDPRTPLLFVFFTAGFALWEAEFSILRYAVPLEALTGAVIVAALQSALRQRRAVQGAMLVLVFLLASAGWPGWGRISVDRRAVFEIRAPTLPDHSVVAVASKPVGFVLPFLRGRDSAFVGVVDLSPGTRLYRAVARRLDTRRPVLALLLRNDTGAVATLAAMGRRVDTSACRPVRTPRASGIVLCPTRPSPAPATKD